ncbi:MAG: hypothetical protein ACOWW1_05680 [archaeon]
MTVEKVAVEIPKLAEKDVKAVFGSNIDILVLDDCFVEFSMMGKYDRKKFNDLLTEVRGYCGTFLKGRFRVPLASLGMLKNE